MVESILGVGFECFGRMMYSRRSWMPPPDGHGGKDAERAASLLKFVAVPYAFFVLADI